MSFSLERTTNDLQDEAMAVAEGAAKAAFGTRFKRVPRALFAKLSLPVISVIAVVAFVFGATMDVLRKWAAAADSIQRETTLLSFWSLTLHEYVLSFTTTLAMIMYLCCVYRDPGRVPAGYAPDPESLLANGALVELKRKGGSRFCKKCVKHKPPRAHHCRQCNRCVLRMDHHCVWVNNCVGHRNYKSFFFVSLLRRREHMARDFVVSVARVPRRIRKRADLARRLGGIQKTTQRRLRGVCDPRRRRGGGRADARRAADARAHAALRVALLLGQPQQNNHRALRGSKGVVVVRRGGKRAAAARDGGRGETPVLAGSAREFARDSRSARAVLARAGVLHRGRRPGVRERRRVRQVETRARAKRRGADAELIISDFCKRTCNTAKRA
mmetsp:Transcript_7211/g.30721  ORF Transcript_7211/g.30721 Transcript_7211/m.30721 type:complete len:385 (-) Transcript_7211:65-1219(-)